jgi:hypothetical protein
MDPCLISLDVAQLKLSDIFHNAVVYKIGCSYLNAVLFFEFHPIPGRIEMMEWQVGKLP